jgi:hypothetical protein
MKDRPPLKGQSFPFDDYEDDRTLLIDWKAYYDKAMREGWKMYQDMEERWVIGSVTYMPLRLAYATTVHKSQGLDAHKPSDRCYRAFSLVPRLWCTLR